MHLAVQKFRDLRRVFVWWGVLVVIVGINYLRVFNVYYMQKLPYPVFFEVFAAYETGLASGTSLKLHVTPRTTAREVVDLVVNQLNMAVVLKGQKGPTYTSNELPNFCLVAVIGARERCLRDDFKPLQLQNPWKKGRLYVRQKQDVLAALEHSSKHTAYL